MHYKFCRTNLDVVSMKCQVESIHKMANPEKNSWGYEQVVEVETLKIYLVFWKMDIETL